MSSIDLSRLGRESFIESNEGRDFRFPHRSQWIDKSTAQDT